MGEVTAISWCEHTFNPWIGCMHVSPACDGCLDPDTPVLMADGSWRKISTLAVGDELYGFEEGQKKGRNRFNSVSKVEAVWATRSTTITVKTESGRTVTCSPNHLWLTRLPSRTIWRRTDELTIGSVLGQFGDPDTAANPQDPEYLRGYFAGATAGDGTMRYDPTWRSDKLGFPQMYWRVAVLETDRPVLERICTFLHSIAVTASIKPFANGAGKRPMLKVECRAKADLAKIAAALLPRETLPWKAGWLAGFLDTDGFCSKSTKAVVYRWSQLDDADGYLTQTQRLLGDMGFRSTLELRTGRTGTVVLNARSIEEKASLVGAIAPVLPRKGMAALYGMKHPFVPDRVVGLEWGPKHDLIDITTSSRTFVAAGLSTHNCYAEAMMDKRYKRVEWGGPGKGAGTRVRTSAGNWHQPLRWDKAAAAAGTRPFVFCASLADVFDNQVPDEWRADLFDLIRATPHLVWLLLTKRPQLIVKLSEKVGCLPANVALGTTVEDQERAINLFRLACAARDLNPLFTFASFEPLLGPVDPTRIVIHEGPAEFYEWPEVTKGIITFNALLGAPSINLPPLGWAITGGETDQGGHKARPTHPDQFRSLRDQCRAAGVPFHLKQMTRKGPVPADLQIQERPSVKTRI